MNLKPGDEITFEHPQLRLGYVSELYDQVRDSSAPKQLDLLNRWFPGLFLKERQSDGTVKELPEYIDRERMIYVTRYHGRLYLGSEPRVTQIAGRLIGTASSNQEKERLAGEYIQKNTARRLLGEIELLPAFLEHTEAMIDELNETQKKQFHYLIYMFALATADDWYARTVYERDEELYAMDEEVFDSVIYNAFFQITRYDHEGLVYGFAWLLLGSLLRNQCGRLTRTFDSSFVPLFRHFSEDGSLQSSLHYLIAPQDFEHYYTGDDCDQRFPGYEWYCDSCHAHLNEQPGFDDHLEFWQCRACGSINPISESEVYDSEEHWRLSQKTSSQEKEESSETTGSE